MAGCAVGRREVEDPEMKRAHMAEALDRIYHRYNRREFVHPDPLEVVYRYSDTRDREIAGLIAASLAYGRVAQILQSLDRVLKPLGSSPFEALSAMNRSALDVEYRGFKHRWTTAAELVTLLAGTQDALRTYGSLEKCFAAYHDADSGNTIAGLAGLVSALGGPSSLLSDPTKSSACKRIHLYLRWMVRKDDVDPGCWNCVDPAHLIIPLDTHMHRAAKTLRLTRRKQPNRAAALDVTRAFNQINPGDPLKYDFALTRFGIRNELSIEGLSDQLREKLG
jgi:uncharacterized protein (TIGR02757 family)